MTERCGIADALALAAGSSSRTAQGADPGPNPPIRDVVLCDEANRPRLKAGATEECKASVVRIVVASVEGSAPREAGAAMLITTSGHPGSPQGYPIRANISAKLAKNSGGKPSPMGRGLGEGVRIIGEARSRNKQNPYALTRRCAPPSPHGRGLEPPSLRTVKLAHMQGYPGSREVGPQGTPDLRYASSGVTVRRGEIIGTIGGGQLEFEAIAHARTLLAQPASPWLRDVKTWPLGPSLGQCCGGVVRVLFERYSAAECAALDVPSKGIIIRPVSSGEPIRILTKRQDARDLPLHVARPASDMLSGARPRQAAFIPARRDSPAHFIEPVGSAAKPLFIYGAGHVGRAIVKAVADLDFAVSWVDVHADRFPAPLPDSVTQIVAADPANLAETAPDGAYHLVLTYSHALDLAICHALLLKANFGFLGLIGSASKRARFLKRLGEAGIAPATLARLTCPIGIGALSGKEPAIIAISAAAQLIERLEHERGLSTGHKEGELDESGRLSA